jgi:cytochrome b
MNFLPFPENKPESSCWVKIRCKDGREWDTYWHNPTGAFAMYGCYSQAFNEWVTGYCVLEDPKEVKA